MPLTDEELAAADEAEARRAEALATKLTDMDWLLEVTVDTPEEFVAALVNATKHAAPEAVEQADSVRGAILGILAAVGKPPYAISARGHATPGHDHVALGDGTTDAVTITVAGKR